MTATPPPVINAAEVARRAKSNLAFALACLPAQRRRDMITLYAFCRLVDDIADEDGLSLRDRRIQLAAWRRAVRGGQDIPGPIGQEAAALPVRYGFDPALLEEIIDGVSMDLEHCRYQTLPDLMAYCYKVASAVGLASLPIFGLPPGVGQDYAIQLGYGLQLTNILRDVRADWANGQRLYLPLDLMARHGVTETDIAHGRRTPGFLALMADLAARAEGHYAAATAARPAAWAGPVQAAEAMRRIYHGILLKMKAGGFLVFDRRYRLSNPHKAAILARSWIRAALWRPPV